MTSADKQPLALIAGEGSLPKIVCETALKRGIPVVAVAFSKKGASQLEGMADVRVMGVGEAEKVIALFRDKGCKNICLIGKMEKKLVFENARFDFRALKVLGRLLRKDDSSIMRAIMSELESEGFVIEKQTDWLPPVMASGGVLGKCQPSEAMRADFEFGIKICRQMADLEIGQTIIVKQGVVLAVEGVEGSNEAIERGCKLGGEGTVLIKAGRPSQDKRFDIPTVGEETVRRLKKGRGAGLAVEAGNVIVVDLPEVVAACDAAGIALAAI